MKKWEYIVEKPLDDGEYLGINTRAETKYLESMGNDGWELVNVTSNSLGNSWVYHWKRELISKPELEKI